MAQGFKTLIFLTIPLNIFVAVLVCVSLATQHWVDGSSAIGKASLEYNFGLFGGSKRRAEFNQFDLTIVCNSDIGVCMFSCGEDSAGRDTDLLDLLSESPCSNLIGADNFFCGKSQTRCNVSPYKNEAELSLRDRTKLFIGQIREGTDPRDYMLRLGSLVSSIFFLDLGLIFTVVTLIFSAINSFSNPIETIKGVHGLVLWNAIAASSYLGGIQAMDYSAKTSTKLFLETSYFLTLCIWGGEFEFGLKSVAPISDTLRPQESQDWNSCDESSLGYSFWMIFIVFILHTFNLCLVIYYIRRRFKPKRSKPIEPKAGNTGNEMIF